MPSRHGDLAVQSRFLSPLEQRAWLLSAATHSHTPASPSLPSLSSMQRDGALIPAKCSFNIPMGPPEHSSCLQRATTILTHPRAAAGQTSACPTSPAQVLRYHPRRCGAVPSPWAAADRQDSYLQPAARGDDVGWGAQNLDRESLRIPSACRGVSLRPSSFHQRWRWLKECKGWCI